MCLPSIRVQRKQRELNTIEKKGKVDKVGLTKACRGKEFSEPRKRQKTKIKRYSRVRHWRCVVEQPTRS